MGVIAYDVQVCLCKMINISAITCFNVSKEHPYISSCLLFMFLLYLCCPLFFWILIYSLPLAVCTGVVVSISGGRKRSDEGEKISEDASKITKTTTAAADHNEKRKKSFSRVRSVRQRRAKETALEKEEAQQNAVAKSHAESHAIVEEIRQAEAVNGWKEQELYQDPELMRSLKLLKDEEDARDEANKVMEVGISEAERNKRLESLIERRRTRKMLSLQVRRSLLMNADAATAASPPRNNVPAAPIVIPKINTWCSPGRGGGTFSPTPGSAPSVMIPMRNPFDLPYDPQEEKPDLTGDSFHQEFALGHNRDHTFCRHESFSLGPSQPMEFFDDRDDSSSIDNFGFRRRRGYHFSRPETDQESDTDFGPTTEPESGQESESKSNTDSPDDNQIKEVIQVHENAGDGEQLRTWANGQDELSLSSSSSSSSPASSDLSEDERPVRIINREAILKSLSMRRNSVDIDTNDQLQENNLSYANSALENASRLKQQYFAEKPHKRHGMTFSIASDMQVEVSEISSPPLTIDENMSHQDDASGYDGEMERNASWDGLDSWAGSSRVSETEDNEARPPRAHEADAASRSKKRDDSSSEKHCIHSSSSAAELSDNGESQTTSAEETAEMAAVVENNVNNDETVQRVEGEGEGEASSNEAVMDANDLHQERPLMQNAVVERFHQTTISPKSVLQPTLSMASFEPDGDDEVQIPRAHSVDHSSSTAPKNSTSLVQFTVATSSNGDAQVSSGPSNAPTLGATDPESSYEKLKINQENVEKPKEVVGGSISQMAEIHESPAQTRDESSSSRSLTSNVEVNDTESVNQKLTIQENDEKLKGVANGSSSTNLTSAAEAANESVDEKLKIQENDQQPKKVDRGSSSSSISSQSNEKEMVIQESIHNDNTKTRSCEGHIGNSVSQEDTGHEHDLNKPEAHEMETNSTTSNHLDGRKDEEVVDSDAGKSKNVISESFKKDEAGEEAEQHSNLHETMPESINTLNSEAK